LELDAVTTLLISVVAVLVVSGFCSLSEASLYAVRRPYVRQLVDAGSVSGSVLEDFKGNMDKPITAILVVNTLANTAGAAIAGAKAVELLGPGALLWFSAAFTAAVLFLSEIFPKVLGVVHNRPVARAVALPWQGIIRIMYPITATVERVTRLIKPTLPAAFAPEEEVAQFARLSAEEGSILEFEARIVHNALRLNEITARDIMTPRRVTVRDVLEERREWTFSRIPLYDRHDPERWTGMVRAVDVLRELAEDRCDTTLAELARPLHFVPEGVEGHVLLEQFLEKRSHLFVVLDGFGGVSGVATLEDVIESLIGSEIVDEVDRVEDMQETARAKHKATRAADDSTEE
jgi:CBS domain containing-hemolysin-like protein